MVSKIFSLGIGWGASVESVIWAKVSDLETGKDAVSVIELNRYELGLPTRFNLYEICRQFQDPIILIRRKDNKRCIYIEGSKYLIGSKWLKIVLLVKETN